jgi:ABC-2 type transport system permease protein
VKTRAEPARPVGSSSLFGGFGLTVVAGYALRACFPAKRRFGLLLPALGALLFGLLSRAVDDIPEAAFARTAGRGLFGVVIPVGCLVVGDAVLGSEVRSGTFHFTWLSPVGFRTIAAGRWLAGTAVTIVAVALPCALATVLGGVPDAAPGMFLAAAAASAAYVAIFVLVGAMARRAVVWSLAFVVLVERLLGTALSGIAQWTPSWLGRAVYAGLSDGSDELARQGVPEGGAAVVRLLVLTAVMLAVAGWRLGRLSLSGPSAD